MFVAVMDLPLRSLVLARARQLGPRPADDPAYEPDSPPNQCTSIAASTRVFTSSFARMWDTWTLTVFSLMNSLRAISRLVRPSARTARTRRSRSVSRASRTSYGDVVAEPLARGDGCAAPRAGASDPVSCGGS